MHISVVMAIHNRIDNVRRALHSWSLQTRRDFSLVVADDGSTDDIQGLFKEYVWAFSSIYVSTGGDAPKTVPVALNMGTRAAVRHLQPTHIWYTDGDIIFHRGAVEHAYEHLAEYPNRVIAGRYDWMPPMVITIHDLERRFQAFVDCQLPLRQIPGAQMMRMPDHRQSTSLGHFFEHRLLDGCGAVLGANTIIPVQAWHDIGGWDEHIPGANANDCDFGWCLTDAGYHMITCQDIMGYHQWHPRNAARLSLYKVSLPYIFRKHDKEVPDQWKPYDTHQEVGDA